MHALLRLLVAVLVLGPASVFAQEGPVVDHQPVDTSGAVFVPPLVPPPGEAGGAGAAVQALNDARAFCGALDVAYRIDCLAERFAAIAAALPATGVDAAAKAALQAGAVKLRAVARANADPAQPRRNFAAPSMPRPQATTRPLTPVAPDRQAAAAAQAEAVLEETATLLLRSSETQPQVAVQVRSIAAAVESNKVLLRSG